MTPRELMAAFDIVADAPDGVKRLRELVLSLAVRGKLVEQDPGDEPATTLLSDARAVKRRHTPRWTSTPVSQEEMRFDLPEGWTWARMDDVCIIASGVTKGRDLSGRLLSSYPYLRVANVQAGYLALDEIKHIEIPVEELEFYALKPGDVLLTEGGDWDKLGRSAVWSGEIEPCIHQNHVFRARPTVPGITPRWLSQFTNSQDGRAYFQSCSKQTTNLASINMGQLKRCPLPLPPTTEQHRIVARVDELMALLDRLESAHKARDEARRAARNAALAALRDAPDADAVETAWARISEQMDELFTMSDDVEALRQLVLHVAVAGLLVPQGPECQRLGAQAAHAPTGWTAGKMDDWFEVVGGIQKSGKRAPGANAKPYLRVANVQRGRLVLEDLATFELFDGELERYRLQDGDILVVEGNGSESEIGRCARWNAQIPDCVHQNHLIRCRPRVPGIEHFAILYLNSPRGMNTMRSLAVTTSGLYNLSVGKIKAIDILLPPLEEQHRIVAKVDALMSLCDALESRLRTTRELHAQFAAAAAHHLDV